MKKMAVILGCVVILLGMMEVPALAKSGFDEFGYNYRARIGETAVIQLGDSLRLLCRTVPLITGTFGRRMLSQRPWVAFNPQSISKSW